MKNSIMLLCLLTLTHIGTFGQEEPQATKSQKSGYRPHSIGISQRFGGGRVWAKGLGANYNQAISLTSLDFYTEKRKGKSQYTPLVQFRFAAPMGSLSLISSGNKLDDLYAHLYIPEFGPFISAMSVGFLFGGSQYIFDKRNAETGTGWSMLINGGFTMSVYGFSGIDYASLRTPISLGGEISFKPVYNFSKNVGITFGFDMGYEVSFSQIASNSNSNEYPSQSDMFQHAFTYGFSVGVLF